MPSVIGEGLAGNELDPFVAGHGGKVDRLESLDGGVEEGGDTGPFGLHVGGPHIVEVVDDSVFKFVGLLEELVGVAFEGFVDMFGGEAVLEEGDEGIGRGEDFFVGKVGGWGISFIGDGAVGVEEGVGKVSWW